MPETVEPDVLVNAVLGKVTDVLINGDGNVIPKSDDHYVAFMSPGIPMLEDDFNYALEGFGGVYRKNVDNEDPENSVGPQKEGEDGGEPATDPNEPPVESLLAQDALQKYMRAESFFNIVDLVPDTSGIVDTGRINTWNPETRISRVYAMALQQSQVYDNSPDEETKEKIARWRSHLKKTVKKKDIVTEEEIETTEESDLVKAYHAKMQDYVAAALEYNNLRVSAMAGQDQEAVHRFAMNGSLMQMKLRAAMSDWSSNGFKGEYEALTAAIQSVEERAFVLLKQRYKEDYMRSILTNPSSGSNFLYCQPASASFAREGSGWSDFHFNRGSFASQHKFTSRSTGGAGGFAFGPVVVAGGGSVKRQRWEGQVDRENFVMRFKLARVPISRPWLNIDYLLSGYWRFDSNNEIVKNSMISDGNSPPDGLMPAITTDCIFIKDLFLNFGSSHSDYTRKRNEASGSAGIGFGPFHIGGRHARVDDEREYNAEWDSQGIRIPGLQLLGFVCYMLPQSPNPNPNIDEWI